MLQAQAAQLRNYIGKVVIASHRPAGHSEFYIWVDESADIDVGSTFLVVEDDEKKSKMVVLPVDAYSTSTSDSEIEEFYSSDVGNPSASPQVEPRVIAVYKVRVVRRHPSTVKPPTSRMKVRFAAQEDIDFMNQAIRPEYRVLAGFVYGFGRPEDPDSWIPLYYDARYIAGDEGAHVMIAGRSGLAAKTSYALFLIFSFLQWARRNGKRVAVFAFNVKQCDLFRLASIAKLRTWDEVESLIDGYFEGRPDLAAINKGLWRRIRREFGLGSPSELIPVDKSGRPMLYFWTYSETKDACLKYLSDFERENVNVFSYGIEDLEAEELKEVLAGGSYASLSDAQKDYVDRLTRHLLDMRLQGSYITFKKLLDYAREVPEILDELSEKASRRRQEVLNRLRSNPFFAAGKAFKSGTIRVMARKVENFISANSDKGLELARSTGHPISEDSFREGIHIIQLNLDGSEAMQRLVFEAVLRRIGNYQQTSSNRFDHVLVFVDELNKFAPRRESSPIKDKIVEIAARARSINIGLVGAHQLASLVDEQVYANASTFVLGNTDEVELKNEEYRKFGDLRALVPGLPQGEVVIYQLAAYSSPIKVRFPIMPHLLATEGGGRRRQSGDGS